MISALGLAASLIAAVPTMLAYALILLASAAPLLGLLWALWQNSRRVFDESPRELEPRGREAA
ncbi:MAG TPA: hypothetical protein VFV50_19245 [Bdellovibrionales bacterium]|nr:hypothetical protein [Bdellovibrionales bacterium]